MRVSQLHILRMTVGDLRSASLLSLVVTENKLISEIRNLYLISELEEFIFALSLPESVPSPPLDTIEDVSLTL